MNNSVISAKAMTVDRDNGGVFEKSGTQLAAQRTVNKYFDSESGYWDNIYKNDDLQSTIYRDRQAVAIKLFNELKLAKQAAILEAGCGAGVLTTTIAEQGYHISAFDSSSAMKETAEQRSNKKGLSDLISITIEDVHNLSFKDKSFDAAFALGVLPWLHSPEKALGEIKRTLKPGGYLIVTVDNKLRLNHLLDPRMSPLLEPIRRLMKSIFETLQLRKQGAGPWIARMHSPHDLDSMLSSLKIEKVCGYTLGFGPFMFLGKRFLPDAVGKKVNRFFQRLADRNFPLIRSTGSHYIVVGRRPADDKENFTK